MTNPTENHPYTLLFRELMLNSMASDIIRVILTAPSRQKALSSLLLGISEITGVRSLALFRVNLQNSCLEPLASEELSRARLRSCRPSLDRAPLNEVLESSQHVVVKDPGTHHAFESLGSKNYMVYPLGFSNRFDKTKNSEIDSENLILWLDTSPPSAPMTAQSIASLLFLNQQAALVLENLRIRQVLSTTNKRLKNLNIALKQVQAHIDEDLDRARSIQKSLLPSHDDSALPAQSAYRYFPAGAVGGDYFDCFELEGGRTGLVIADVAGHGIAASMIMSMFKVILKTLAAGETSPCKTLQKINSILLKELEGAPFITAFYAVFEKSTRKLTYCNAGHIPQYLLEQNNLRELTSQGLFLGAFPDTFLKEETLIVSAPGRLVLLTDGLTESADLDGRLFSRALEKLLKSTRDETPSVAIEKVMEASLKFHGNLQANSSTPQELSDDITVAILDL